MKEIFTPRQLEVAILIADGLKTKEIAKKLGIDARTVEVHREIAINSLREILNKNTNNKSSSANSIPREKAGAAMVVHFLVATGHIKLKFLPGADEPPVQSILSRREFEVLILLAAGCINKEVGNSLKPPINDRTVQTHRARIYAKLSKAYGMTDVSAAGLTHFALAHKLLPLKFTPSGKKAHVDAPKE